MTESTQQKTFTFELVSPERRLIGGEARMAVIPGVEGDFGVLAGHSALLSALRPGVVTLHMTDAEAPQRLFISGGFADVGVRRCVVLAEEALAVDELDRAALETELSDLREDLADEQDAAHRETLRRAIAVAAAKLYAITGTPVAD